MNDIFQTDKITKRIQNLCSTVATRCQCYSEGCLYLWPSNSEGRIL